MEFPMQLVCAECGQGLEFSGDSLRRTPSDCPRCGAIAAPSSSCDEEGSIPSHTPSSLELTPEDLSIGVWSEKTDEVLPPLIDRFRPGDLLGGGGFGQVYRARDARLDRDVALKVLRDPHPPARVTERFFREARAAAQLDHPNIVPIHDAGRDGGRCWIAYQYVAGRTLARHRDGRSLAPRDAVAIVRALADALDHAHGRGVFHRDVKPANVIIDPDGRPRLTDFGLARRVDFDPTMTQDGAILGTPCYMSPEQAQGRSHLADARSDLYSLGVMLHELLHGFRPNQPVEKHPTASGVAMEAAESKMPRKSKLSASLVRICERALAKKPEDRYETARAFAEDLDDWLQRDRCRPLAGKALAFLGAGCLAFSVALAWRSSAIAPRPSKGASITQVVVKPGVLGKALTSGEFVVRRGFRAYHRPDCAAVPMIPEQDRMPLTLAEVSASSAYEPCVVCRPPAPSRPTSQRFATPLEAIGEHKVVATAKGERFHWAACQTIRGQSASTNFKTFETVEEAKTKGRLKPCQNCEAVGPSPKDSHKP